jgi:hypothetical protein
MPPSVGGKVNEAGFGAGCDFAGKLYSVTRGLRIPSLTAADGEVGANGWGYARCRTIPSVSCRHATMRPGRFRLISRGGF